MLAIMATKHQVYDGKDLLIVSVHTLLLAKPLINPQQKIAVPVGIAAGK
jgi:hypothetical protein